MYVVDVVEYRALSRRFSRGLSCISLLSSLLRRICMWSMKEDPQPTFLSRYQSCFFVCWSSFFVVQSLTEACVDSY